MNQETFEKLQYNQMKETVESYCVSSLGRTLVRELMPSGNKKVVLNRLEETSQARRLLDLSGTAPLHGVAHIGDLIEKIEKDIILNGEQITEVAEFLRGCRKLQTYMKDKDLDAPLLKAYSLSLTTFSDIEEEIDHAIRNHKVCDEASNALKKIRRHMAIAEDKIEEKLNQFLKHPQNKSYIQEFFVSKRQGKLTVPIKAAYKGKVAGTVVESTDKTAFMEISSVGKYNAELLELQIEESVEEYKILSYLTGLVYEQREAIRRNMEVIGKYDLIFAKAKYSKAIDGRCPKVNDHGFIHIKRGRHPLLTGDVVPLDFKIGTDYRSLIITGPNAGGKTIVLKTVGLLTLALQSGLHVPVGEDSQMSVFDKIYVDIGDGQSIENALSTFSSHVKNLAYIVNHTNKSTLLLFDEIGSGTEPGEGAALAIAILEEIYQRGAMTIATTHYNEIKDFSNQHPDFQNAAMQFNRETLEPLYKLLIGQSGESNALWIAKKMGIAPNLLKSAAAYMQEKNYDYTKVDPKRIRTSQVKNEDNMPKEILEKGDKVMLLEHDKEAIVYRPKTQLESLMVYCDGELLEVDERRVKLAIRAAELYPQGYDLNTLFTSFRERKLEKDIARGSKKALKKIEKDRKKS
ncbi:MAG: endonuclease MutS2 [Cellulosilyticaceae bacterium]